MIKIVANMKVQPEKLAEFKSAAKEIVEKSRAESGNLSYSLNQSTADANTLAFIEIWKDQSALDSHKVSEHFTRILPQLVAMCSEAPAGELYTEIEF